MARTSDDAPGEDGQTLGRFPITHWSVISLARKGSEAALARLCENYRAPVIAFLRSRGVAAQDVEDVAHGFFAALLSRNLLQDVSQDRGRFRTWLARSVENHLHDCHDKHRAQKRGGGQTTVSLQETDERGRPWVEVVDPSLPPDTIFPIEWVKTLVHRAWAEIGRECVANQRESLFTELGPVLWHDPQAPTYREVARRLRMTEGAVKMAAKRLRDRLGWLIRDQVKRTLLDESEFEPEVRDLLAVFAPTTASLPASDHPARATPSGSSARDPE